MPSLNRFSIVLLAGLLCGLSASGLAQSLGNAGTVSGVVSDPNGAVIAGATVVIQSRVTGYRRSTATDEAGSFRCARARGESCARIC